ncbi:MAG: hypothetical protein HY925_13540, partial [Elusimicrobia bacterium]|nr:hypothetical protein [Elusimicrobiota bacterium]
ECKSRGAFELITKPFQIDDIVHLIDCALEKHRVGRAAARENGVRR